MNCEDCEREGTENPARAIAKGLCSKHYQRKRHGYGGPRARRKDIGQPRSEYLDLVCALPGCGKRFRRRASDVKDGPAYCSRRCFHQRPGRPEGTPARRQKEPRIEIGTRKLTSNGYVEVYVGREEAARHHTKHHGYVFEHRLVMAEAIGRPLLPTENVHHKHGGYAGRSNNDPRNLELWTVHQPRGHRIEDVVAYCREMLGVYGDEGELARYAVEGAALLGEVSARH